MSYTIHAQDSSGHNRMLHIKGIVQDTSGRRIPHAVLYVYGDTVHVDSSGHFKIAASQGDSVVIKAKGFYPIGYRPHSDTSAITLLPLPVDTSATANNNLALTDSLPHNDSIATPKVSTENNTATIPKDSTIQDTLPKQKPRSSDTFGEGTLEDVVVVGYGTQQRRDMTSAVATISGADMINRPSTNNISALQGVSPGLIVNRSSGQPGQEGYTLQTRGYTSVNGGNLLGLVDGVNGDISAINPFDIESITVLKDASAAAIYGARAAGGVILLTTRKGKKGFHVNYNTLYGIQKSVKRPNRLNSWQEAELANEASTNAGPNPLFTDQQISWMRSTDTNYVVSPTDPANYDYYDNVNQIPMLVKNRSIATTHNVTFSGAGETDNYYFSLGYYDQNGLFRFGPDNTNRLNLRFNYNKRFNDIFDITSNVAYRKTKTASPSYGANGIFDYLYSAPTYFPIYVPGTDHYISNTQADYAYAYLKDGGASEYRFDEINTMVQLRARNLLVPHLTLRAVYGGRYTIEQDEISKRTIKLWNITDNVGNLNYPNSYEKDRNLTYSNNLQVLADYDRKWGQHSFHLLGGYTFEDFRQDNTIAIANNLSSNELFTLNIGDPTLAENSEDIQSWAMSSFLGRLEYNYAGKYLFQATMRYDGSSRLDPSSRWQSFPSLSAGWRLPQESWFNKALPFFNEFKIRASWGRLGNSDGVNGVITNYDYIAMLVQGTDYPFNNTHNAAYYQQILPTKNKRWEIIDTKDIGIDIGVLNNKLSFTADYYVRNNFNMLVTPAVPAFVGITPSSSNNGRFQTKGWEIAIAWNGQIGTGFNYWVKANLSDNTNKVISYGGAQSIQPGQNYVIEGQPINTIWGFKANGLFQSQDEVNNTPTFRPTVTGPGDVKYVDINGDNAINYGSSRVGASGDLVNFGDSYPHYLYGISFGFKWKGIDFSTLFQGVGKRHFLPSIPDIYAYSSATVIPLDYNLDYWTTDNPNARFPRMYLNGTQNIEPSSYWLMNGAYLRLKNLQLGYTLPSSWLQKYHVNSLRIFFSGQDLWEISHLWIKSLDPETASGTAWRYQIMRNYSFGVNLNF
ncbi:MAG: SusC/RagA family TonB-linked outer membrane protein [Chitinophagaceae bacterium]